jgi:PGF-pre-PGF domain-containing protein
MHITFSRSVLVFALIILLVIPGTLLSTAASDQLFPGGEPDVTIQAVDGPNGEYVSNTTDGQVTLVLSGEDGSGVNLEATTQIRNVFKITNTDTRPLRIWVTDTGANADAVTLVNDSGFRVESNQSAVTLTPGESVSVGLSIDTNSIENPAQLIHTVSIHTLVDRPPGGTNTPTASPAQPPAGTPEDGTEPTPTQTPTETPTQPTPTGTPAEPTPTTPVDSNDSLQQRAEVTFDNESTPTGSSSSTPTDTSSGTVTVSNLSKEDIENIDAETADRDPRAIIRASVNNQPVVTQEDNSDTSVQRAVNVDGKRVNLNPRHVITRANSPVTLSGEQSLVSSAASVTQRGQITSAVDISVPPERRNESATVRLRVDRESFAEADPTEANIGHRTNGGWELLETTIVEQTSEYVILETRTTGFSPFAVFVQPEVQYRWRLPDGTTQSGRVLDYTFTEPGVYNASLTITDALGRQNTTTQQIVANDVPQLSPEVIGQNGGTGNVTLAANVDDRVGNTTVTWIFPDGTEKTGPNVTHTLPEGEHSVEVRVEDEFGAVSSTEATIAVGPEGLLQDTLGIGNASTLGFQVSLSLLGLFVLRTCYRRLPWRYGAEMLARAPSITALGEPFVDLQAGRVGLSELRVTDTRTDLDSVTIELFTDTSEQVVRKTIEIGEEEEYQAAPESILLPSGTELDRETNYRFRVTAVNIRGRSAVRSGREFTVPQTSSRLGQQGGLLQKDAFANQVRSSSLSD